MLNIAAGMVFVMIVAGITSFASFIALCIAVSVDKKPRIKPLSIVLGVAMALFIISGFLAFAFHGVEIRVTRD